MKNGKAPTREQKKMMKAHGLVPENWLVVKNLPDSLEVVSRVSLKKVGGKPKTRGEMNTLYRDSIIQVLSTKIDNYRKTDILQPSDDMVLEQDKVIMAGDINVTVRNVVQSARGKE